MAPVNPKDIERRSYAADALRVAEEEGARHPSSQRFHDLLAELGDLHDRKQRDYGRADDPFANVRASEAFGMPAWVGVAVRMQDKMKRIQTASNQKLNGLNVSMANESLEDAFMDLAVYALIAIVMMEEQ